MLHAKEARKRLNTYQSFMQEIEKEIRKRSIAESCMSAYIPEEISASVFEVLKDHGYKVSYSTNPILVGDMERSYEVTIEW